LTFVPGSLALQIDILGLLTSRVRAEFLLFSMIAGYFVFLFFFENEVLDSTRANEAMAEVRHELARKMMIDDRDHSMGIIELILNVPASKSALARFLGTWKTALRAC